LVAANPHNLPPQFRTHTPPKIQVASLYWPLHKFGNQCGARTHDPQNKSPMLYRQWFHVHFVSYNRTVSIVTTRNTTQQVASKMFRSVVCCDSGKGPNKNNWQNRFHCVCVHCDAQFWISMWCQSWYSICV